MIPNVLEQIGNKMKLVEEYKNRYGDIYKFYKLDDGNALIEGDFKWMRMGCPNIYDDAYIEYMKDVKVSEAIFEPLTFNEFKFAVHKISYSRGKGINKYQKLITSDKNTINMIDPSGGPYLAEGMELFKKRIKRFEPHKNGYKIVLEQKTK